MCYFLCGVVGFGVEFCGVWFFFTDLLDDLY